jgi:hypothetical protein
MKAIDRHTKRNSTGKLTIAVISECPLLFLFGALWEEVRCTAEVNDR